MVLEHGLEHLPGMGRQTRDAPLWKILSQALHRPRVPVRNRPSSDSVPADGLAAPQIGKGA
jgi:hypothetical protein